MAPPTILYNNANAKYTNYEQPDQNKILETEVALAKSMLTMNIETFNTNAPSGNMDINYSLVTPGTSNTQPLTHLMLNQQMNDLGSVFAFVAEHDFDNTNGITDESAHLSFDTTSGYGGNGLTTVLNGTVSASHNSASYYDATVGFETDNTEHTFQDNEDNINKRYTVTYDQTSAGNFNSEKSVNSRYSSFITDSSNIIATPDVTKNDPLQIFENTGFNEPDSLYTEMRVLRDTTTNILSVDPSNITHGMTSLTNTSGQYYYSGNTVFGDGYIGVPDDIVDPSNERAFFGALRFTQTSEDVIDISGSAAGSNSTTLCMVPSDPGSSLPTSMTKGDFDDLFTSDELPYVGQDYNLNIREYLYGIADPSGVIGDGIDGGYYTNGTVGSGPFRGFDTDDTSVKRNTTYMRKCAEEGQDFSQSVQTVEIVNGDLIATRVFTGPNADLLINRVDASGSDISGNPTPHDTDETLALTEYQNDYWVKTYFTEPSTSVSATYHRAEEAEGNSSTYTDFRVIYDTIEDASSSILPNDRRSRYYDNFDITTIFPATVTQGAVFSGSKYVGINQGFAAVFQEYVDASNGTIVKKGINLNSDYTFTSSAAAASTIADNEIAILHLNNTMIMSNENTMFTDATTSTGIVGTTVSALGEQIDLTQFKNPLDNTTSDLRVKFDIKGGNETGLPANVARMDSTTTNNWFFRRTTGNFFAVTSSATNMFGNDIYDMMSDLNTTIPITFNVVTNGIAENRDGLTLDVKTSWTWNTISKEYTISGTNITQVSPSYSSVVPVGEISDLVIGTHYRLTNSAANSTLIASKLSNTSLKARFETRTFTLQAMLPFSPYTNASIRTPTISMLTKYYEVLDVCGNKLPDSYLNYLEGIGRNLTATRIINDVLTKASCVVSFSVKDLYAATAVIQKFDGSNNWVSVSPSVNFDPVHNQVSTFELNDSVGKIYLTSDITNQLNPTSANAINLGSLTQTYYIGLTTDNISYSVVGKKWDVNNLVDAEAITSWAESESIYSTSFPTDGTTINGLVAYTTYISPESSNFNTQPDLTLTVIDASGSIWAKFVTNSKNITSDFNILFARRPVFHIVETYKDVTITVDDSGASWIQDPSNTVLDTYKMAGTSTQLQVIDGVELTFDYDTGITDSASYRLLGDYVEAALYNGYEGPYSTLSEVTFANGLVIADSIARDIDIKYYRGNSVRTAVSPATYEEFRWNRSVTQIYMKIVNTNASSVSVTYTDTASDLYDGSTHTVTNLSGSIGDLGLKFYGNLSRFRNVNTTYTSQDLVMNQPITILFDAYVWSITNPYNTTTDGAVNALQDSSGVVFTNEYSIVNYTGSNPMNIVAGRVWIRNPNGNSGVEESFNLYYELPTLKVDYLSEQYVGNPVTFNWTDANRIDEISFADVNTGRFIKTPSSTSSVVIDSFVYIKIAPIILQDYVGYSLLPRPQIIVEAIATKDVSTVPFNYDVPTRTSRGIDIDYETNSHYPFAGKFGTHNGTIGGYRVANDMEVVFNNDEFYYDLRFDADFETDKRRKIYIPSNKIKLELYKGYGHTTLVEGLKIGIIYEGYIHKLKNYDVDAFSNVNIYQDLCGNVIDSNTYNNYDGTFLDGQQNSDLTYDLAFSQNTTVISPLISSSDIYGQLAEKVVNIELQGISAFMDLTSVAVIDRHIDLLTGDSVKLNLYGHIFKTDVSDNLVVEFVKYTTGTGYDFSTNAAEIFIKNLGFNASTRETATVILKTPSSVLTAIPYNFVNVCNRLAADLSFNSLTWVTDTEWAGRSIQDKQLAFNMVCLSTVGQAKLTSILGVSTRSPWRMLVSEYPHRLDLRSGDGSPVYGVDSFGKLTNLTTSTQVVSLSPQTVSSSDNDVQEYGAYNVLLGNSI